MRKVPTIARPPIISGSSAATRLRKNSSESRKSSGKASISAIRRSFSTCLLTCSWATAAPPTTTPGLAGELVGDRRRRLPATACRRSASARRRSRWSRPSLGDEGGGVGVVVAGDRLRRRRGGARCARAPRPGPGSRAWRPARPRPRRAPPATRSPASCSRSLRLRPSRSPGRRRRRGRGGSATEPPTRAGEEEEERSRRGRCGGRCRRRGGRGRRTSAAPFLGSGVEDLRLHPLAPVGEPLGELDPAPQHHQREGVRLAAAASAPSRAAARRRRGRCSRIARRISTASSRGSAPAKNSFSSPSSRISKVLRRLPQPGLQLLLAVGGDLVDGPLAAAGRGVDALDQPGLGEPLQLRVDLPVAGRPEEPRRARRPAALIS